MLHTHSMNGQTAEERALELFELESHFEHLLMTADLDTVIRVILAGHEVSIMDDATFQHVGDCKRGRLIWSSGDADLPDFGVLVPPLALN